MTIHKNINCAWRDMPTLQDGDTIDGGNWTRPTLTDIPQNNLTFLNKPNMGNCNLTGTGHTGSYSNLKKAYCYNKHYDETLGNTRNLPAEAENCPHATATELTIDGETITLYEYADEIL